MSNNNNFQIVTPFTSLIQQIFPNGILLIPSIPTEPDAPQVGLMYFNTTDSNLYISVGVNEFASLGSTGQLSPALQSIASLVTSGNEIIYTIASNTYATSGISPAGRSFLTLLTSSAQRNALGLTIGVDVQAQSNALNSINAVASSGDDNIAYTSSGIFSSSSLNPWARANLLNIASVSELNTLLGTITGTVSTTNRLIKVSGTNQIAESGVDVDNSNNITNVNNLGIGGNITLTGNLDGITPTERSQLANIDNNTISSTQWGYLSSLNQGLSTSNAPTFAGANFTENINMGTKNINNIANPLLGSDVANKTYVDSVAGGVGLTPLQSASVATATALPASTYSSALGTITVTALTTTLSIDGVSIVASDGQRIVVKNQVTNSENGVYTRTGDSAGHWVLTRTSDFNTPTIKKDTYVFVQLGTQNAFSSWLITQDVTQFNPVVAGSSVIWAQFSGAAVTTAGNGITIAGTTISVNPTSKFTFAGSQLDLNTVSTTYGGTGLVMGALDTNKVLITDPNTGANPLIITKTAPTGDFVGTTDSQSLTNKTITSSTNNVISRGLFSNSGTNTISSYASANPTTGQVLTATNSTTATWQNPAVINPSNTLYVYKNANNVSPNYTTLAAAIADPISTGATATTPCLILMSPGTYEEVNPLNIPQNNTIAGTSEGIQGATIIKATLVNNIINVNGNVRLSSLIIDGAILAGGFATIGLYSSGGTFGSQDFLNNITVRNCSATNIKVTGTGAQYSKFLICKNTSSLVTALTTTSVGYEASLGGVMSGFSFTASAFLSGGVSTMTTGIYCHDDFSYMDISIVQVTSVGTGINIGVATSNTQSDYPIGRISNAVIDLYTTYGIFANTKSYIKLANVIINTNSGADYTNQLSIFMTNPALPADPNFAAALWLNTRQDKSNYLGGASNNLPEIRGCNLSETPGDLQSIFAGNVSLGTAILPAQISVGGGNSYITGMVVFVYDGNTNTSVNRTTEASLEDTSSFPAFPSPTPLTTNDAIYIGGSLIYYGLQISLTTVIAIASGLTTSALAWEYWNGSSWSAIPFMITLGATPYTNQGQNSFGVGTIITNSTTYHYRFGNLNTWSTTLAAGASIVLPSGITDSLRYYVRARVIAGGASGGASQINTIPQINRIKLHSNRTRITNEGYLEYYGNARPRRKLVIPTSQWFPTGVAGETAPAAKRLVATTWATSTISASMTGNDFKNNDTTSICFPWQVPNEIDTSYVLNFNIQYSRGSSGGVGGTVIWQVDYIYTTTGDLIGDPTGAPTTAGMSTGNILSSAPTVAFSNTSVTIPLSILGLLPSVSTVWLKLTRFGTADVFAGDCHIINIWLDYAIWATGYYSST
jgi:hypothetical protein